MLYRGVWIPKELITIIISFLPIAYQLRSKRVCKEWLLAQPRVPPPPPPPHPSWKAGNHFPTEFLYSVYRFRIEEFIRFLRTAHEGKQSFAFPYAIISSNNLPSWEEHCRRLSLYRFLRRYQLFRNVSPQPWFRQNDEEESASTSDGFSLSDD